MKTEKLYYTDPYKKTLNAKVVEVDDDKVYLDKTICYPEGGGQPGDVGKLDSFEISDTQKDGDAVYHVVKNNDFKAGDEVNLSLDWNHRYKYMKMHTAQHIVSGVLYNKFGVGTLSVHQGDKILTIEIDRDEFPLNLCHELEDEANIAINSSHDVSYIVKDEEEAQKIKIRRSIKAHGIIRFVDIEGVDLIACGGLHVGNTSEVSSILYVSQEIVRSHVRLIFKVAEEAKSEIRNIQHIVSTLNVRHSTQTFEILDCDKKSTEKILELERENRTLCVNLAKNLLSDMIKKDGAVICEDVSSNPIDLSFYKDAIDGDDVALLLIMRTETDARWMIYLGPSFSHFSLKILKKEIFPIVNAKGGGRPPFFQGKCDNTNIDQLFESFRTLMNEKKQ